MVEGEWYFNHLLGVWRNLTEGGTGVFISQRVATLTRCLQSTQREV